MTITGSIIDNYRDPVKPEAKPTEAVVVVTPQDCMSGACGCGEYGPAECKFPLCSSCQDNIIHIPTGRAYIQATPDEAVCFTCGGPL